MAKETLTYEKASKELDEILAKLEEGTITVDQLATKVERASELLKFCQDKLRDTETKVENIIKDLDL